MIYILVYVLISLSLCRIMVRCIKSFLLSPKEEMMTFCVLTCQIPIPNQHLQEKFLEAMSIRGQIHHRLKIPPLSEVLLEQILLLIYIMTSILLPLQLRRTHNISLHHPAPDQPADHKECHPLSRLPSSPWIQWRVHDRAMKRDTHQQWTRTETSPEFPKICSPALLAT